MSKVSFYYRKTESGECKIIAVDRRSDREWEAIIPQPYPFEDDFWYEDQHSERVMRESRGIARRFDAPVWVYD